MTKMNFQFDIKLIFYFHHRFKQCDTRVVLSPYHVTHGMIKQFITLLRQQISI